VRYVVYGTGAVGGVVGAHLHLAGLPVTLVARGEHLARIRADGLVLDRGDGRHVVRAETAGSAAEVDWSEPATVLLAVKGQQTALALDDLAAHAPSGTVVVALQNGVANEAAILRRFAATYAVCVMLPATHLEPGVVVQRCWPTPGILDVGRFPHGIDPTSEAIAADLRAAGFASEPREQIMAWKHRKLLANAVGDVFALFAGEEATRLAEAVAAEGEAVLAAAGIPVVSAEEDTVRRGDVLRPRAELGRPGNSLVQSLVRGLATEVHYRCGEIVLLGRLHGVATPASERVVAAAENGSGPPP
jgi:2-dehydropantoate 2-reductase